MMPIRHCLDRSRKDASVPIMITGVRALDIRFPTSLALDGSDAMNPDPDYSAAYCVLDTDHSDGLEGHGLTFTVGRGNEVCAYLRQSTECFAIVVVARFPARIRTLGWENTQLILPASLPVAEITEVISGREFAFAPTLRITELLRDLPAAVLVPVRP